MARRSPGSLEWRTVQHGGIGSNGPSGQSPVEGILAALGQDRTKRPQLLVAFRSKSRILKPFARWTDDLPVTIRPKEAGRSGGPNYRPPSQTPSKSGGSLYLGRLRPLFWLYCTAQYKNSVHIPTEIPIKINSGMNGFCMKKLVPAIKLGRNRQRNGSVIAPFPHQTGLP